MIGRAPRTRSCANKNFLGRRHLGWWLRFGSSLLNIGFGACAKFESYALRVVTVGARRSGNAFPVSWPICPAGLPARGVNDPRGLFFHRSLTVLGVGNTKSPMMQAGPPLQDLRVVLAKKQLPSGGWAALSTRSQTALEATALACIALGHELSSVRDRAVRFLLDSQNPNGSWPAFLGDDKEGAWVTALALIALRDEFEPILERLNGFAWLADSAGRESNWFWKWKFRTTDRHVRFDPDKFGWPWIPHTNSWVVPTAFAILALNQLPCACALDSGASRIKLGIEMLLDRACPSGGWNAGNGVVYGVPLAPHADDTAIALLALRDRPQDPLVQMSLDWLERVAPTLNAPWSLAWSVLALAAHDRPIDSVAQTLAELPGLDQTDDIATLSAVCLALDYERTLPAFGVTA